MDGAKSVVPEESARQTRRHNREEEQEIKFGKGDGTD